MKGIIKLLENKHIITLIVLFILVFISIGINYFFKKKNIKENYTFWILVILSIIFLLNHYKTEVWMNYSIFSIYIFKISIKFILIIVLTILLISKTSKILTVGMLPRVYQKYDVSLDSRQVFNTMIKMILIFVATVIALNTLGISLNSLAVFGSVLGVGLAFGLQNITANFISGLILIFDSHIKIGDRIKIGEEIVDVEKIGFRATVVKSLEDKRIIVPNLYFLENSVENMSHGSLVTRLTIPIGVSYDSDVKLVEKVLKEVAEDMSKEYSSVLRIPSPFVFFEEFAESSLSFKLFVWISDPKQSIKLKSIINFKIFEKFKENNIEIPYPKRDVYIKNNL
ncbi:mechanosensitive ion channel domain-containing protein [Helcococcus bovis]|uniref:mechanosensitive ion channel family protein n=1 Tax=Helcococcus bovis TaxID=3153252 RepID=UPI0038B6C745